ncbi:MAG TPA: helix-turn-helix transcriptional regulator [Pseudonocardiaceae bacterium]|nr:helix-turn-helix transcriptional regulator [Pseudonocardiaceae bacterium]
MTDLVSTARRRELGAELRRLREQRGLMGLDIANRLCWTPTSVSRAETGKRAVTQFEVLKYTTLCGLTGEDQDALVELAAEPDDYRLKPHDGRVPDELRALIFHESTASEIESFQPIYLPGIMQTEDYARAVFEDAGIIDRAEIDTCVRIRMSRRWVLTRVSPAQCTFLVHENALHAPVGGPQVMYEQMLHLLFLTSRPQCSIRVVPIAAGGRGMAAGSFQIFSYPEGAPVVCVQHESTSEFLESPTELICYRRVLQRVASVALDEVQSRELITLAASDYERQGVARRDDEVAEEQLQRGR